MESILAFFQQSDFPFGAMLVLLLPMIFIAWQSRGKKQPDIKSSCCLPVIDESKRPFQIIEDAPVPGKMNE
jgi:hypothetical protein